MYRLLEVGEVIEKGDEYWSCFAWRATERNEIGDKIGSHHTPHRRLVKPAVTPAASSVPDPGEGYRLLTEGETINSDDDWYHLGKWVPCRYAAGWQRWWSNVLVPHRRRVEKPAPVVSVGDRVKVLTGPWAGCTGVVDVPWGKLNQKTCSFDLEAVSVRLDNVFVGGSRLTVITPVSQVEPLPPVVPEVLYRDLSHGEIIRKGDEFLNGFDCWRPVVSIGAKWNNGDFQPMRRPVRLQSPGWRYLDAGETVQAGDETKYSFAPFWRDARLAASFGYPVLEGHDKYFRRKLPANQGG